VVLWNAPAERLLGYRDAEVLGRRHPGIPRRETARWAEALDRLLAGQPVDPHPTTLRHRDGTTVSVDCWPTPVRDGDGTVVGVLVTYTATDEHRHRDGLPARMRQQAAVAALGQFALGGAALDDLLTETLRTVTTILGVPIATVIRRRSDGSLRTVAAQGRQAPAAAVLDPLRSPSGMAIASGGPVVLADPTALPPGPRRALNGLGLNSTAVVLVGNPSRPWGTLSVHAPSRAFFGEDDLHFLHGVANIIAAADARRRAEDEVRHRATHDALTGLPNRELLNDRLEAALRTAADGDDRTALLLIDLDGFKDVNDSQGHQAGDIVLRQVAVRLRDRLDDVATVARLGGDEFAVVLSRLRSVDDAIRVAASLHDLLRDPFDSPGGAVSLGGSIGIALAPDHGADPYALLRRADLAMYRAKRERCGFAVHDPEVDRDASDRLWMVNDLRQAIAANEITVAFQPVVDLRTHVATSVEALARWVHPIRGPLSPNEFVPLAEASGLISDLTERVVRAGLTEVAEWFRAGRRLAVGVNLSAALLSSSNQADLLRDVLAETGLPPEMARVEVTETALASDTAVSVLRRISAMGVRVAVDDFGTRYSSLGRLKQLPVQTIKIDRSFVTGLAEDRRDVAIVRSVVALARELGLRVIAEGVETVEVERMLGVLGVQRAQGHLFSPPLDATRLTAWHDGWLAGDRCCCQATDRSD
jgi:diguanylate cyclase (GGDEF)-like protein/PAS domain S-box-containing protein